MIIDLKTTGFKLVLFSLIFWPLATKVGTLELLPATLHYFYVASKLKPFQFPQKPSQYEKKVAAKKLPLNFLPGPSVTTLSQSHE